METAPDGEEGLARIASHPPALVLLDAMLPRIHGFEVARRLRADVRTRDVPVVMMTAVYRGWRFAQDARDAYGAEDYIEKPFRLDDVVRRIESVLEATASRGPAKPSGGDLMLRRGKELLLAGRLEAAASALEEAIAADPFSAEAHHQLARTLRAQGEHFRAMTSFERAVELRADFFPALRSLAALYAEKGFRRKAVETLERALVAAPDPVARDAVRIGPARPARGLSSVLPRRAAAARPALPLVARNPVSPGHGVLPRRADLLPGGGRSRSPLIGPCGTPGATEPLVGRCGRGLGAQAETVPLNPRENTMAAEPTLSELAKNLADTQVALNIVWTMVAGFLVMFMQAGFALVETGLTRAKNVAHTMGMNFLVYAIGIIGFYFVGFGLQMGGMGSGLRRRRRSRRSSPSTSSARTSASSA